MPDYSKGKIYTIRNRNDDTLIYVGSTIQPLSKRWGGHKTKCKKNVNSLIYSTINNDWTDWYIELYVEYPCENKEQLDKKEGEVIREIATLNTRIAGRTKKEYREENEEYYKIYREINADFINERNKEYYKLNADEKKHYQREYRKKNVTKEAEYHRQYRQANAEKRNEYMREYSQRKKLEKQAISN